jgi:hypothetical protein
MPKINKLHFQGNNSQIKSVEDIFDLSDFRITLVEEINKLEEEAGMVEKM